ncbi:MAG TPA: hypothetical protein VN514_01120 [Ignavibacteria bacterium]|nr:hypothetical protein [Ignavibacteria bacterium]
MPKFSVSCLLFFSFLLTGCYTIEQYSDTPDKIISGKSLFRNDGSYFIDSIILKSNARLVFPDYVTGFFKCGRDSCTKLIYQRLGTVTDTIPADGQNPMKIVLRRAPVDSINAADIKMMFYRKESFDYGSFAYITGVISAVPLIYFIVWMLRP